LGVNRRYLPANRCAKGRSALTISGFPAIFSPPHMMRKHLAAFTLIELLIVITIIAVLASIALPAYNGVKERGDQTKDLSNAKQVALALRQFAIDNNGSYPSKGPGADYATAPSDPPSTSNDAFWWLFPNYLQSEQVFTIAGSAYTPTNPDNKLDNVTTQTATRADSLRAGENGFAYITGLTDTSNPTFPIIADGFANGTPGTYTKDKSKMGGVWSGKKAIVVFCDASGQIMPVNSTSGKIPRSAGGAGASLFDNNSIDGTWLSASNRILNPDPPAGAQ
jgi:prepilin-type N-terminal cleavage/methylation domain-containing protein